MKTFWITILLTSTFAVTSVEADPKGKGKGKGKGKNSLVQKKGKGNAYAKGREKHQQAAEAIANVIALETSQASENYADYATKLADTLGQLDAEALSRVLGDKASTLP